MKASEIIRQANLAAMEIVRYGNPSLVAQCALIEEFDESLAALSERMFELMFHAKGVGLAGPQVGVNVRLFVACPSSEPGDRQVYVNPNIVSAAGWQEEEEGCLSVPGVAGKIKRRAVVTVRAMDLRAQPFEQTGEGLLARIFQHEIDHLDGVLLVDRMGSLARLAHRKTLKELLERHSVVGK